MSRRQTGTTTVEFAIAGGMVVLGLIALIEVLRAFFVLNTVGEATRRAARQAVVCPMNDASVKQRATEMPGLGNLTSDNLIVEYLTETGDPTSTSGDVRFVRVAISDFRHSLLLPVSSFTVPPFRTMLPAESLGYLPDVGGYGCLGT